MRVALPLALAALVVSNLVAQSGRFTVGIVRLDGRIVPFAAYDSGRWERAWPEADETTNITTVDNIPSVWSRRGEQVPNLWQVWPATGGTPTRAESAGLKSSRRFVPVRSP